jgi:lambda family phage tail tape measure protein
MATGTVALNVTGNASQQLSKIKTQVDGVGKAFGALRNVLGGIAISSVIQNTLRWAASIQDVADATGLATANVIGFTRAVQENGGSAEGAANAMNKFILSISEAAEGGFASQEAFRQVGVTLQDLRSLSEQDLFNKAIQGLSQITDRAERAKVANELFGKSLRGVKLESLGQDYASAAKQSEQYVSAVQAADRTQKQLEKTLDDLRIVLLTVLEPLADFTIGFRENMDTITKWAKLVGNAIFEVGKIILFIVGPWKILRGVIAGGKWLYEAAKGVLGLAGGVKGLAKAMSDKLTRNNLLKEIFNYAKETGWGQSFKTLFKAMGDTAAARAGLALLGGAFVGTAAAYRSLQDEFDGSKPLVIATGEAQRMDPAFFERGRYLKNQRDVEEALAKEKIGIMGVVDAYKRSAEEKLKELKVSQAQLNMSENDIEVLNLVNENIRNNQDAIQGLRDAQSKLATDSPLHATYGEAIKQLEKLLPLVTAQQVATVRGAQAEKAALEELNFELQLTRENFALAMDLQGLQDQVSLIGLVGDELEDNILKLDIQRQLQSKLLQIAGDIMELKNKEASMSADEFNKEMERHQRRIANAYDEADARVEAEQRVQDATRAARDDTTGAYRKKMEELRRSIDPAVLATEKFDAVFKGIEGAIDELVTTGKMNFKDFALSIIADLLRIQLRAIVVQALLAAIGAIFGTKPTANVGSSLFPSGARAAANGANALAGQPFLIGEQGPELFVPKTAGTIVPNHALGTGQVSAPVTNVVNNYNINAVDAKSVAQLFAENRKSLLGAVGMAQKEMPYMMG